MDSAEMKRVRATFRDDQPPDGAPKRDTGSIRREDDPAPQPRSRSDAPIPRTTTSWDVEAPTGTRLKRENREPVTVDEVGTAAVKLARTRRPSAPKLLATRNVIAKAPIDTRAAFVLSLVDGRNTLEAIVDMAGMPEDEVRTILLRLARLGLISLP